MIVPGDRRLADQGLVVGPQAAGTVTREKAPHCWRNATDIGLDAEREPQSGAASGNYDADTGGQTRVPKVGEFGAWLICASMRRESGCGSEK